MSTNEAVNVLVQALLKRASANEVEWSRHGARYTVLLPEMLINVSRREDSLESQPDVVFEVDTTEGHRVIEVQAKVGEREYGDLQQLLKYAETYTTDWDRRLLEAARLIEQTSGNVGSAVGGPPFSPPPPPQRPTDEQVLTFFEKVAGRWNLTFEKRAGSVGTESLEIDETGMYYTFTQMRGEDVARTVRPTYRIVLVSCDAKLEHVEISKQALNGKVRQIEVLTVSPTSMVGYAKHDEHRLTYTKVN